MKAKLVHYQHKDNGLALYIVPESEIERAVLRAFWEHGKLETTNGIADNSEQGFAVRWRCEQVAKPVEYEDRGSGCIGFDSRPT